MSTTSTNARKRVSPFVDFIAEIVPLDTVFRRSEIIEAHQDEFDADWIRANLHQMAEIGLLESVEKTRSHGDTRYLWRVRPAVADEVQSRIGSRQFEMPCGHRGFTNDGGDLTCTFDGCDERFGDEEVDF